MTSHEKEQRSSKASENRSDAESLPIDKPAGGLSEVAKAFAVNMGHQVARRVFASREVGGEMSIEVGKEVLVMARVVMLESADGKDCLVEFRWHDGTVSRAWVRHEDVLPARSFVEPGLALPKEPMP